ncbi:MAG: hypothetical protein OHK93_006073 [Ramalina farinacea]|uniref:2'-phosphotransferase n=1 Tax=Ramalina farinacea TaxID=258253 RepID=A0AA43TPR2_9LECA|nr:hypothetical protein [Ramalina farinacea]
MAATLRRARHLRGAPRRSLQQRQTTLLPQAQPAPRRSRRHRRPPSSPYAPRTTKSTLRSPTDDPSRYLIRAAQGHSIPGISSEQIHTPILATDPDCPFVVVHGTNHARWLQIHRSGHLNRMTRNHIHFARDELRPLPPLLSSSAGVDEQQQQQQPPAAASRVVQGDEEEVISGMRRDSTVMIWVDVRASMAVGVKWWRSTNDVILTEGLDGKLPLEFVAWTEKGGGGRCCSGIGRKG